MKRFRIPALLGLLLLGIPAAADESGIKLTTLPERDRIEIQLAHDNATLVEEERTLTLLKGSNRIQFSWDNVQIDGGSILFRPLDDDGVRVLNVNYPPNQRALTWEVFSDDGGPARIRISYLLSGAQRSFSYRAVVDRDEKELVLRHHMTLRNLSGEGFEDAGLWSGFGKYFRKDLSAGEGKMMLLHKFTSIPVTKTYTFDAERTGEKIRMHYVLTNDRDNDLGLFPLPHGKVRIFIEDGRGGEAFLGEDWGKFTPVGAKMRLSMGLCRDVVVKRKRVVNRKINPRGRAYDLDVVLEYEIENFKEEAVELDLIERIPTSWETGDKTSDLFRVEKIDAHTMKLRLTCPPGGKDTKQVLRFHYTQKNLW